MRCKHCGKPISQRRFPKGMKWMHMGTYRIYCTSYTKAEPTKEET